MVVFTVRIRVGTVAMLVVMAMTMTMTVIVVSGCLVQFRIGRNRLNRPVSTEGAERVFAISGVCSGKRSLQSHKKNELNESFEKCHLERCR
jgi:hypothetical protein